MRPQAAGWSERATSGAHRRGIGSHARRASGIGLSPLPTQDQILASLCVGPLLNKCGVFCFGLVPPTPDVPTQVTLDPWIQQTYRSVMDAS